MKTQKHILMDMDGVIVRGSRVIPGAPEFIARLQAAGRKFLVLTNNPAYTARDLAARLAHLGLAIPEHAIWSSALATAQFLHSQRPNGTAYALGEAGLTTALHDAGYTLTDQNPDYVVLGVTTTYSFERFTHAVRLIAAGMETTLVLTGVTAREQVARFPYQPTNIIDSVADIEV